MDIPPATRIRRIFDPGEKGLEAAISFTLHFHRDGKKSSTSLASSQIYPRDLGIELDMSSDEEKPGIDTV